MRKQHRNAEHTTRFGSCNENRGSVFSFCDAAGSWDAPAAELDMFSRWIKLADDALAAKRKSRKRAANRIRRNPGAPCNQTHAGALLVMPQSSGGEAIPHTLPGSSSINPRNQNFSYSPS